MKIGILSTEEITSIAAVYGDVWIELPAALRKLGMPAPAELRDFIRTYHNKTAELNEIIRPLLDKSEYAPLIHPVSSSRFLPPVPECPRMQTGRGNSALFTRAIKLKLPKMPVTEIRPNFNMVGHESVYELKGNNGGWNLEIVMVIGRDIRNISREDAYDAIFGYTCILDHSGGEPENNPYTEGNEFSFPDSEKEFIDWAYQTCWNGNVRAALPVGPVIVTRDEIPDPHNMLQKETQTGRLISLVNTNAVLYTFDEMAEYLSSFMTLEAGDMFSAASMGYDGYPMLSDRMPKGAYYQGETDKLPPLRLYIDDQRKL